MVTHSIGVIGVTSHVVNSQLISQTELRWPPSPHHLTSDSPNLVCLNILEGGKGWVWRVDQHVFLIWAYFSPSLSVVPESWFGLVSI